MNYSQNYFKTTSLDFASILVSLGFKLSPKTPMTRILSEDGKHQDTFYFHSHCDTDDFGQLEAREVWKVFQSQETDMQRKNPEAYQAIEYASTSMRNRTLLIGVMKEKVRPIVKTKVGEFECFMPLDASDELKAKMQHLISEVA